MENILEEENSYFRSVVKDALKSLKSHKTAYVFTQEQIDYIKGVYKELLNVSYDGQIYYLTLVKKYDKIHSR